MKRIFKDFRNIKDEHMLLIRSHYPRGFSDSDLSAIKTSDGDYIDVLEIKQEDTCYLFRMNHDLLNMIDDFNEKHDFTEEIDSISNDNKET